MKKIRSWCIKNTNNELIKLLRMAKVTFFVMLVCLTHVSAKVRSQNMTANLNLKNVTVEEVVNRLERQLKCNFFFNREKVDVSRRIDVALSGAEMEEIVRQVFGDQFSFWLEDDVIVISPQAQKQIQPVKMVMEGVVKDKKGGVLPGVTVLLKGTSLGTSTNENGVFSLTVPKGPDRILVFSFVGMKEQEMAYKGEKLEVVLEEDAAEMDEVVVTGIFTKSKESYTGAATTITAKELQRAGNRNILTSIRNIDPGFNIADNVTFGSDPNKLPDITIRGNSSLTTDVKDLQTNNQNNPNLPLFIMDGFEISLERMNDLDENQVESITLLKDASATAMYGTRGANGVVVITTKQPEPGRLRVTYKGSVNIEAPDLTSYNLLDAREKLDYEVAARLYNGGQDLKDLYNQRLLDVERGVNTYWLKYPVRTGVGHRHSLRLEGGNEAFRYAASIGYNSIQGAMKGSERNTVNGNMFLSYRYKNLSFQNDLQVSANKSENSPYGTFNDFAKINSYYTPYDEEGKVKKVLEDFYYFNEYMIQSSLVYNPLYNALLASFDRSRYTQIQNNFAVEWQMIPSLTLRGRLGITSQTSRSDQFISPKNTKYEEYGEADLDRKGEYTYGSGQMFNYEAEFTLNYSQVFAEKHQLYVGLSYNFAQDKSENYHFASEGFQNEDANFLGMAGKYQKDGKPAGTEGVARRTGGILNANYTYNRRYFLDFSGKFDGSSKFGADNRFALFWSAGGGWNIHNEAFLANNDILNVARLRFSYGTSGAQSFSAYQALKTFKYFNNTYHAWNGSYLLALGNKDLGWQQTKQLNIGAEVELFHGQVRLNVDVYNKVTDDLLSDITLPITSGFGSYKANIGKVQNKGVELTFNVYPVRNTEKGIIWSVGGTLAHNKNIIKQISNSLEFLNDKINAEAGSNPSFLFKEGESINTLYVVPSLGIDPSNGQEVFVKADGTRTYTWDAKDKVACGVAEPKIWGNLNTMFRYKGITLNAVFGYRAGGQMYNQTLIDKIENILPYNNADRRVLYDRWKNPGDHAFFKAVTDRTQTKASSRFVMDENTLECRSLSLAYDFESPWVKRLGLDYLTITGFTEDVFRLSTIKQERGLSYPFARKFSVSLTARF